MAVSDTEVQELIKAFQAGNIRLPEMQRGYVWTKQKVCDLLDSLYRDYPSGTILMWASGTASQTRRSAVQQDSNRSVPHLLLDGQQRLTSLHAALTGEAIIVEGKERKIEILFNLEHPDGVEDAVENDEENIEDAEPRARVEVQQRAMNERTFAIASPALKTLPHWISVSAVFADRDNSTFIRAAGVDSMDDPRFNKYNSRLNALREIESYEYRVDTLDERKTYAEVTDIFVRVNSRGTQLRSADLALAQITARWPGSLSEFENYDEACRRRGFDLGLRIHLKTMTAFATGYSRFRHLPPVSAQRLKNAWQKTIKATDYTLNFLKEELDMDSSELLSSHFIVVALSVYFDKQGFKTSRAERKTLRRWILVANAKGRYSRGASETTLDQDLASIRGRGLNQMMRNLEAQVGRLHVEPADLDGKNYRSSYFKAMFMAFRSSGARDWRDSLPISVSHAGTAHKIEYHHIFPRKRLSDAHIPKSEIDDLCNLAFISSSANKGFGSKPPARYLPELIDQGKRSDLQAQCIPLRASRWDVAEYARFIADRRKLVAKRLNEFLDVEP